MKLTKKCIVEILYFGFFFQLALFAPRITLMGYDIATAQSYIFWVFNVILSYKYFTHKCTDIFI